MKRSHREAIAEGRRDQILRDQQTLGDSPRQGMRRCCKCREIKAFDLDDLPLSAFALVRRETKLLGVREYPDSTCRECGAIRAAAWREKKRAEGELRKLQKQYDLRARQRQRERHGHEEFLQLERERQRAIREREGAKARGPWKRNRVSEPRVRVPVRPFLDWLDEWMAIQGISEFELVRRVDRVTKNADGTADRALHRLRYEYELANIETLDGFVVACGMPEILNILYPLDSESEQFLDVKTDRKVA